MSEPAPAVELVDVVVHYGARPALRHVDLRVERGELLALVGPNGMGKTTLLRTMAGALTPIHGEVRIDGRLRGSTIEDEEAIRQGTCFLPDDAWLPRRLTGREFLLAVGQLYGRDDLRLIEHIQRLIDLFQLEREAERPVSSYSTGQKKKIALCGALVTEAPLLLLDEPFSGGLDPAGILALKRVLPRLVKERRATIVMSTPVPELVEELATRIAVVAEGELRALGTLDELRRQTGRAGSLTDVLEELLHPQTRERIERYFQDSP